MKEIFTKLVIVAWVIGAPLVVKGITSLAVGPTRVVQGIAASGPGLHAGPGARCGRGGRPVHRRHGRHVGHRPLLPGQPVSEYAVMKGGE